MAIVEPGIDAPVRPSSRTLTIVWLAAAATAAVVVPIVVGSSLPVLTLVWLAVAAIVLRRSATPAAIGLVRLPGIEFIRVTITTTVAMTLLFAAAEVSTHPYRQLLDLVSDQSTPDSTFAWLIEHGPGWGLVGFAAYGALVTIFAEEIVFRGALMVRLRRRGRWTAVVGTTIAFAALQALPAALLPPRAAFGFLVIDAVVAVGIVGGLAAHRTRSIYPTLVAVTVANVVVLAAVA